ncbi:hypothetical protein [Reyranella sp.]|uniref:hypothetical protein n=1 Tax=Reyranella sp. TaxID=1929291 RepID=UPI003BAA7488
MAKSSHSASKDVASAPRLSTRSRRPTTEKERLQPGTEPQRVPQPQPPRSRHRNAAALPGSQNADLKGPKPKRGPRGMGT